ncbi:conserved exported hypothetical protein [Luteimonas sp. 9C]|uniref:hypothetical protein n=1 Tax=Luteimonas sp. 9C TaxID=2653148 RepID=UPI0012F399F5|nr:hypothetical protein [Luteimonas sp. 9C]VXB06003.1 conserved exported hypothetical protein [Luteimonas sp. 9C]
MRMSHTILLSMAFSGLAAGLPALASDTPPNAPVETLATEAASHQASAAAQPAEDRMVCTREKPIGSNYTKRVCRKASEMQTLRGDTQDAFRNNTRATGQFFEP